MKSKIKTNMTIKERALKSIVIKMIPSFISLNITSIIAFNLLPTIADQRGYFAIGGEWFLLIALFYSIHVVVDVVIDVYLL